MILGVIFNKGGVIEEVVAVVKSRNYRSNNPTIQRNYRCSKRKCPVNMQCEH